MRVVTTLAAALALSACSGKDTASISEPKGATEIAAVSKHRAAVERANEAVPSPVSASAVRYAAIRPYEGTWLSQLPFEKGLLRMVVASDGSVVMEALTDKGATVSMATGSVLVGADGSASGRLSRPLWPLQPFSSWKARTGSRGGMIIQGSGQSVAMSKRDR